MNRNTLQGILTFNDSILMKNQRELSSSILHLLTTLNKAPARIIDEDFYCNRRYDTPNGGLPPFITPGPATLTPVLPGTGLGGLE